jgi:hypothetical protein
VDRPIDPATFRKQIDGRLRSGQARGFIGKDGQTHAKDETSRFSVGRCGFSSQNSIAAIGPFIANPKAPLCGACVAAIEAEIQESK